MATLPSLPAAPLPPSGNAASNSLSFQGLNQLKAAAEANPRSPQAIKAVAQQFEALLMQQMLNAMNATSLGPDMLGDTSGPMFKSMFTQQLATTLSQGQGIGLASFIARELSSRYGATAQAATPSAAAPAAATAPGAHAADANAAALPLVARGNAALPEPLSTYRQNALPALAAAPAATPSMGTADAPNAVAATPAAQRKTDKSAAEQARSFIASILPSVQTAAKQLGVAPVAILAQAALETGWGQHTPGNNVFGVKAGGSWSGSTVQTLTREFQNGVSTVGAAAFRAYQNVADSVDNYAALLSRPRYQSARGQGHDISAFASALQRSGYATDPDYAAKIVAIAQSPRMQQALAQLGVSSSFSTQ